jgi:hypothetical protein
VRSNKKTVKEGTVWRIGGDDGRGGGDGKGEVVN